MMPQEREKSRDISGLILFVIGIFLAVTYYLPGVATGTLGRFGLGIGKGLWGPMAFMLPVFFIYAALEMWMERRRFFSKTRLLHVVILLTLASALAHLATVDETALYALAQGKNGEAEALRFLSVLWKAGYREEALPSLAKAWVGGIFGGLPAEGFRSLAGTIGAYILLIAGVLVELLILFNLSITRALQKTQGAWKNTRSLWSEHRSRYLEQRAAWEAEELEEEENPEESAPFLARKPKQQSFFDLPERKPYGEPAVERSPSSFEEGKGLDLSMTKSSQSETNFPIFTAEEAEAPFPEPTAKGEEKTFSPKLPPFLKKRMSPPPKPWTGMPASTVTAPPSLESMLGPEEALPADEVLHPVKIEKILSEDPSWKPTEERSAEEPHEEWEEGMELFPAPVRVGTAATSLDLPGEEVEEPEPGEEHPAQAEETMSAAETAALEAAQKGEDLPLAPCSDFPQQPGAEETRRVVSRGQVELREQKESPGAAHFPTPSSATVQPKPGEERHFQIQQRYVFPPLDLLRPESNRGAERQEAEIRELAQRLEETLRSFGVKATVVNVTHGPAITRFELSPAPGVKVSRIVGLSDDIALSLAAVSVRIEAPIPGKSAIGIEIPNKETRVVGLRALLEDRRFRNAESALTVALGRDIPGQPVLCDLRRMPHLLIAGATGSGKSVCVNCILMSLLYRAHPDDVKLLMIDPKVVELKVYNGIPHLLAPVVTDPKKAANTLNWAVNEMDRRYRMFASCGARDFKSYAQINEHDPAAEKLPLILLVIDELADLMATAPNEVEDSIARLTAMARAAGIHLIIATQRPSVDVITGVIKSNIPSRIAFAVSSQIDSRTILDGSGAEKLLGKGDMLYSPLDFPKPMRAQGAFVSDAEVEAVISFLKAQNYGAYDPNIAQEIVSTTASASAKGGGEEEGDELLPQAVEIVLDAGYASVSILQRRMNVGYPRAARLIDAMEQAGYIGPFEGSKPRKVRVTREEWEEMKRQEEGEE